MQEQVLRKLFEHNKDLLNRFKSESVSSDYVKEDDIFMITIDHSGLTLGIEFDDHMVAHYNPVNFKIVGFTITDCDEWIKVNNLLPKKEKAYTYKPETIASFGLTRLSFA